jgi:hypothetical protein
MFKPITFRARLALRRMIVMFIVVSFGLSSAPSLAAQVPATGAVSASTPLLLAKRRRKKRRRKKRRRKKKPVKPAPAPVVTPKEKVKAPEPPAPAKAAAPVAATVASSSEGETSGLAVMDLKLASGIDASIGGLLNETIISKLDATDQFSSIISGSDMRDIIDLEAQKSALGCEQDSCLAELGGALGVPFMLVSDLGKFGNQFILNIKLVSVEESKVVGRVNKILKDEAALLRALPLAVQEVVDLAFGVAEEDKAPEPTPAAAASVTTAVSVSPTDSVFKRPLLWAGLGLVGLSAGGGSWSAGSVEGAMITYNDEVDEASLDDAEWMMDEWQSNLERHKWMQPVSNAGMIVGAGIAAYAVFFGDE